MGGIAYHLVAAKEGTASQIARIPLSPFGRFPRSPAAGKVAALSTLERTMESAIFTLGALGVLVAAGWVIDLLVHREPPSRIQRLMATQIQRSTAAIRGGQEA